jgi:hypothetical protein
MMMMYEVEIRRCLERLSRLDFVMFFRTATAEATAATLLRLEGERGVALRVELF